MPLDDTFMAKFTAGTLQPFHHRDHLRMTFLSLRRLGVEAAIPAVADGIRFYAGANGAPRKYHQTLTRFWVLAVALTMELHPAASVEELLDRHPQLLDKDLPLRHWSREVLFSDEARAQWLEPDLRGVPLPAGMVR